MMTSTSGSRREHRIDGLVHAPDDARQMRDDRAEPHHRDVGDREEACHAARLHALAGEPR